MQFLADLSARPLSLTDSKGFVPSGLWLGNGSNALEVIHLQSSGPPSISNLRSAWTARLAGRAAPVLAVATYGDKAAICGPGGDPAPAFGNLDLRRVERICRAALAEPDRHAALRFLNSAMPELESSISGIRNEGLFATHQLRYGLPQSKDWTPSSTKAHSIVQKRGRDLIDGLGFAIETYPGPISILRAGATRRAVAVFLDRNESSDLPSVRFSQLSPISYALAKADAENLDWVIVSSGSALRLYPVRTAVGTGRRGRTETYAEVHLDLIADTELSYLWLIFSADALGTNGFVDELLASSARYAADLGSRLRERIYSDVIPDLSLAILEARGLKSPSPEDLQNTYQMALVYLFRLLFLAYAEDKELLPFRTNTLYRDRSLKHKAQEFAQLKTESSVFGDNSSLWGEIDQLFRAVDKGNPTWGVPAYNGGLFSRDSDVSLNGSRLAGISISDKKLGPILTSLLVEGTPEGFGPVDFRSLGVREFGTIYEGLLENELAVAEAPLTTKTKDRVYAPAGPRGEVIVPKGKAYLYNTSGARKSTGSFFTKHFAVEHLLDQALEPALLEHLKRLDQLSDEHAAKQFFDFRVTDIAMGSAHFLVAAVDRIEKSFAGYLLKRPLKGVHKELERLRATAQAALGTFGGDVPIEDVRLLRRQIARRCIYGIDLNPIAVDLARLSLWIHTFVPGLPLSFLDHSLVLGNALIGIGTVKEADEWLAAICGSLFRLSGEELIGRAAAPLEILANLSDATSAEIAEARKSFDKARKETAPAAALFDVLTAARLDDGCRSEVFQNASHWLKDLRELVNSSAHKMARQVLAATPPFHFPVAFPEVFLRSRPGFDVILGNPPWEEATVEEDRFWARHHPGFHSLTQKDQERGKQKLRSARPDLVKVYNSEIAEAELLRRVLTSGQFPGMGTGDPDVYKAFYWRFWNLLSDGSGWAGIVLPRSAMSAKGSADFRKKAFSEGQFRDFTWLLNNGGWVFDDVEARYTIVLTAFTKRPPTDGQMLPFRGPYRSLERFQEGVAKAPVRFPLSEVAEWTDTFALPLLPSEDSGEVFYQLRKSPRLDANVSGHWRARPQRELDATNDKPLLKMTDSGPEGFWPVFKGESFDIWEPDRKIYYAWGKPDKLLKALQEKRVRSARLERSAFHGMPPAWNKDPGTLPCLSCRIAFRDVTRATDTRTVRAALLPPDVFLTNKAPYLLWPNGDEKDQAYLLGVLCSLPLDWYARRFVEIGLNFFILNPFPIPRPERGGRLWQGVVSLSSRLACPDKRFSNWAKAVGVSCGELSPEEKEEMICELDAIVAHLYGLSERQLRVVFETFHEGWDYTERMKATLVHYNTWKASK